MAIAFPDGYDSFEEIHHTNHVSVFRARRSADDTIVVLKSVRSDEEQAASSRIFNHYLIGKALDAPGVAAVLDIQKSEPWLHLVMEDAGPFTLEQHLASSTPRLDEAVRLGSLIAESLASLHARRVVHRDLTPSNIVLRPNTGSVSLIDLGISAHLPEHGDIPFPQSIQGTLAYIAPEQTGRIHRGVDQRADLYSLGVVIYRMLSGRLPFEFTDSVQLLHAHLASAPPTLRDTADAIPPVLCEIVERLLAKNPEDRYQTAFGLAHDLRSVRAVLRDADALQRFVLGSRDVSDRLSIPNIILGRERELHRIRTIYDSMRQGGMAYVEIDGPPGSGKSGLVEAFCVEQIADGVLVLHGKYDEVQRGVPFAGIVQALRELVRHIHRQSPEVVQAWKSRLSVALESFGGVLAAILPEIQSVIGLQASIASLSAVDAEARFNVAMTALMSAIGTAEHPVIIVLDDLQWADTASRLLLTTLLTSGKCDHVLVLTTSREADVATQTPANHSTIQLGPLRLEDVREFLQLCLHTDAQRIEPLAQAVFASTDGNPFVLRQYIEHLFRIGSIKFDNALHAWSWDELALARTSATTNVDQFVSLGLDDIDDVSRSVLSVASCAGFSFTTVDVELVMQLPSEAIAKAHTNGVRSGIITSVVDDAGNHSYRFAHDRIRTILYDSMPAAEREEIHYRFAQSLLRGNAQHGTDVVFRLAEHIRYAKARFVSASERTEAAKHCYGAAQTARTTVAFQSAITYLETATAFINGINVEASLSISINVLFAECEGAQGNDVVALEHFASALAMVTDPMERGRILQQRMQLHNVASRFDDVLADGVDALRTLGVEFPKSVGRARVAWSLVKAWYFRDKRAVTDVEWRPVLDDQRLILISAILNGFSAAAYYKSSELFTYVFMLRSQITLRYGHAPSTIDAYSMYGVIMSVLGIRKTGEAYGKLSVSLSDRFSDQGSRGRGLFNYGCMIAHWSHSAHESLASLEKASEAALSAGDQLYVAYCEGVGLQTRMFLGNTLPSLEEQARTSLALLRRVYQRVEMLPIAAVMYYQMFSQLHKGLASNASVEQELNDAEFSSERFIASLEAVKNTTGLGVWFGSLCMNAVVNGEYERGVQHANQQAKYKQGLMGQLIGIEVWFFNGLAYLGHAIRGTGSQQSSDVRKGKKLAKDFAGWAASSPETFLARALVLKGLVRLAANDHHMAMDVLHLAVDEARLRGYIHVEAVALEWLSIASKRCGYSDAAEHYEERSANAFEAWGAATAARRLRPRRAAMERSATVNAASSTNATMTEGADVIDIVGILRAANALASEIRLDDLVQRMVSIVLQIGGANRALLTFIDRNDQATVEAEARSDNSTDERGYCVPAVFEAARTGETVIVGDARTDHRFGIDRYVRSSGMLSLLSMPILHQGKMMGVLYLENSLSTHAFTPDRTQILHMLSSQIAVSLENARLYQEQQQLSTSFARFVPTEFLESLEKHSVTDVRLGDAVRRTMTVMFADIRRFTSLSEHMNVDDNFRFLNDYLQYIEPDVYSHGGFIDKYIGDAVMALFPGGADSAVKAAVAMQQSIARYNEERGRQGLEPIQVGIGLHTGEVMLGTVGSAHRMDTTAIGDTVNLASRVENLTKSMNTPVLITGATFDALENPSQFVTRRVGEETVRGRTEALTIYDVIVPL